MPKIGRRRAIRLVRAIAHFALEQYDLFDEDGGLAATPLRGFSRDEVVLMVGEIVQRAPQVVELQQLIQDLK